MRRKLGLQVVGDQAVRIREVREARGPMRQAAPESQLLAHVRQVARQTGWLVYHTHDSRKSEEGFPDLVMAKPGQGKPGRLIFAELKSRTGKCTMEQQRWLALLRLTVPHLEVYEWRPEDWDSIVEVLTGHKGRETYGDPTTA